MASKMSMKRRAIYTGLQPYLATGNLMKALLLWEQKYADSPYLSVQHYVRDITATNNLESQRRELMINLVKAMSLSEGELMADPIEQLQRYKQHSDRSDPTIHSSIELITLQKLIIALLEQVNSETKTKVKSYVLENLSKKIRDKNFRNQLQLWLTRQSSRLHSPQSHTKDLRQTLNMFYVALCEHIGPVMTDKILSKAKYTVAESEESPYYETVKRLL